MVFSSGERCWNGPSRSITVYLRCGGENVLAEVEEPSRCEYAATLYTPAACDAEEVEALERELAEMEEEARAAMGVHDEL
jgi:protein kinase C substrate 80K-H